MQSNRSLVPLARLLILVGTTVVLTVTGNVAAEAARQRQAGVLSPLWVRLDAARTYRASFKTRSQDGNGVPIGKSHQQLIQDYQSTLLPGLGGKSPKQEFEALVSQFAAFHDTVGEEADWGSQEALNEVMQGQLLLGNQKLLEGLRARFPSSGAVGDQTVLLGQSVELLQSGISKAVEELRLHPERLRAGSDPDTPSPIDFYVENSYSTGSGELVENELYRFTDLVNRLGVAGNSRAKRKYFFGNADAAGRAEAASLFKASAQATYLHSAVLGAVQREDQFQNNAGYELKRNVADAQRLFEDIKAGFNPLKLRGDFVPPSELGAQGFINNAKALIDSAVVSEGGAKDLVRDIDQLQTSLDSELLSQQQQYLDQIATITGIPVDTLQADYDLTRPEERTRILSDSDDNMRAYLGTLGQRLLEIERAALSAKLVQEQLQQIPKKIQLEESTTGEINTIQMGVAEKRAALGVAEAIADSFHICACGVSSGTSFSPAGLLVGVLRSALAFHEAVQNAKISGAVSGKRVQELLLEASLHMISLENAGKAIEERKAQLEIERLQLERLVRNYAKADLNLANAYFANPAYRMQADLERENAENLFEDAMVASYTAAKALEFEWSERVRNPILPTDGGIPDDLGASYEGIVSAESVFAMKAAGALGSPQPTLKTFYSALDQWNIMLRTRRSPQPQQGTVTWSLRKDLLGFNSADESYNRILFADFIAKHRVAGQNPAKKDLVVEFAVQLGTNALLPGAPITGNSVVAPNLKIGSIGMNMIASPNRFLLDSGAGSLNPAKITLQVSESLLTRTFFAKTGDDDLIGLDLPGARTGDPVPFNATVDSKIQNSPQALQPSTVFAGLSPAVSRWDLKIDMSAPGNTSLLLENLDDIQITLNYRFGRPEAIDFN